MQCKAKLAVWLFKRELKGDNLQFESQKKLQKRKPRASLAGVPEVAGKKVGSTSTYSKNGFKERRATRPGEVNKKKQEAKIQKQF